MYGHMANWRGCPCFPKPPKGTALNNRNSYTNVYNSIIRPNVSYAQAANPNKISTNFNSQNKQPMAPKGPVNSAQIEANRNPSANNRSIPNFNNKSNNNFNGYNFNGNIFNNNNFNLQATLQMTMQCLCQLSQFTQAIATSNPNFMNNFNQVQRANNNPNQMYALLEASCNNNNAFPDSPTRFGHNSANTIDFALIKNFYYPYTIKSINDLYSDHNPVFLNFDFKLKVESSNPRAITTNWKDFRINLNNNFSLFNYYPNNINNTNDLETKITEFTEAVVATHSHASQPIVNAHRNYTPNHINQLIKHKNNLRKRYQQTLNPFYKTLCNRAQANLKKELKIYSNDTWNARLEALNTTDNSLWEAQRFLKNKRSQIPTLNCATGMAVTDPQKANLLANTIKNNFIENNRMQDNYDQDDEVVTSAVNTFLSSPPSTQIEPVMPDEIINFIKNTSSKKAPGKDTITNKMLKNFPIKLILILTILVNKILKFHHFPSNWKEAIIFPIIKPGTNKNLPNSYRPISLLSTLSKLTEYIILNRLKKFINDNSLINPNQYGFTNKLSTLHPLLRLTESISEGFQKRRAREWSFWISRKPSTVFGF
ncbi:probable RNA-directed DNA polymerase from transposon X-element [Trichonephila clavipes]|uniref:Probable RNA-directed DNA polymerase from transposon X-element n=1 Tax=Trichonephila clavipes TaxID=2585209 RepID=A0A8X6S1L2_TRICX|nr:probable RNA-directed DNA polymerase from transposon X-element [Trichonephila clavipes]